MSADAFDSLPNSESVRRALRLAFVGLLVVTALSAGQSYLSYEPVASASSGGEPAVSGAGNETATGTASNGTDSDSPEPRVVATVDGVGPGQLVAYGANGSVTYHNDSWWIYHDVDPSPQGEHTVTYIASGTADSDTCDGKKCMRNAIERVNLTTGEVTRVHDWSDARGGSTQTHDVDRVNDSVYLVADISHPDRVYMVNTTTGEEIWEWRASEAFSKESGGAYPSDWTHINDVEYLDDGRVMANLRNQDQVVFIEPGEGVQDSWTLGADDDHGVLYEAHNPDYIPAERGGPAVVVADSENNRLVEYQREEGSWERTWHWQDTRMQWPRDADRLPSGRTLVADSHGQRIVSVAPDGTIAWSHEFPKGSYDVEVLGTGGESAGGRSAAALDLRSRYPTSLRSDGNTSMQATTVGPSVADDGQQGAAVGENASGRAGTAENGTDASRADGNASTGAETPGSKVTASIGVVVHGVVSLVPPLVLHGLLYSLPTWTTPLDATLVLGTAVVGAVWLLTAVGARLAPRIRRARRT